MNAVLSNEIIKFMYVGESTSSAFMRGFNNRVEHGHQNLPSAQHSPKLERVDSDVGYLIKCAIMSQVGVGVEIENHTIPSTTLDWHLGIRDGAMSPVFDMTKDSKGSGSLTEKSLEKSDADFVLVHLGLNDASYSTPKKFKKSLNELIERCNKAGKKLYVLIPNAIPEHTNQQTKANLIDVIYIMKSSGVCLPNDVGYVERGIEVELDDMVHPAQGRNGSVKFAQLAYPTIVNDMRELVLYKTAVKIYIALMGKNPPKDIINYLVELLKTKTDKEVCQFSINWVDKNVNNLKRKEWIHYVTKNCIGRKALPNELNYWKKDAQSLIEMLQDIQDVRPDAWPGVYGSRPEYTTQPFSGNPQAVFKFKVKEAMKEWI
jgi:hypothetical protein